MPQDLTSWVLIAIIFALLIWSISRRRRSGGNTNLDIAVVLSNEVDENLKIAEERQTHRESKKKFKTKGWKAFKDKLGFLDPPLTASINEAFTMAEDFNNQIDSARKGGNLAILQDMPVEKLHDPLTKSKDGLKAWLRSSLEAEKVGGGTNTRNGCMGF